MPYLDTYGKAISTGDLHMLRMTLEAWCFQQRIRVSEAHQEAQILIETYQSGRRSQIELIDALVETRH